MRSPVLSRKRGIIRPIPPLPTCIGPFSLKGGVFVDVFFEDAWWEAVLLDDVVSLEENANVNVFCPDEGEVARVQLKDLRVSQLWDEVTGEWNLKGSCNLSRFLESRGITRKETVLTPSTEFEGSKADQQQFSFVQSKPECFDRVCSPIKARQPGDNAATNALFLDMTHSVQDVARAAVLAEDYGGSIESSSQQVHSAQSSNAEIISQEPPQSTCRETGGVDVFSSPLQSSNLVQITGNELAAFGDLECAKRIYYDAKQRTDSGTSEDFQKAASSRDTTEQHIMNCSVKKKTADGVESRRTITEVFESPCEDAGESLLGPSRLPSISQHENALGSSCEKLEISGNACFSSGSASLCEKEASSVFVLPSLPSASFEENFSEHSFRHETDMVVFTPNQAGDLHMACKSKQHECSFLSRELLHAIKGSGSQRTDGKAISNSFEKASMFSSDISMSDVQGHLESVCEEKHKQGISMGPCFEGDDASSRSSAQKMAQLDMNAGNSICLTLLSQTDSKYMEDGALSPAYKASMDTQSCEKKSFDLMRLIAVSDDEKLGCKKEIPCFNTQADCAVANCRPSRKTKVVEQEAKGRRELGDEHQNDGSLFDDRIEQRLELDTLRSFRDRLLHQKRAEAVRRKALETPRGLVKVEKTEKEDIDHQLFSKVNHTEAVSKASLKALMTRDKSLKFLTRDLAKKALLEAGFTIELRPRKSRDYHDSVYMSPEGHSHWSLPKAWDALKKLQAEKSLASDEKGCSKNVGPGKGAMSLMHGEERKRSLAKADENALKEVLTRYGSDERLQSALTKLRTFSASHLEMELDVIKQADLTNADLTDILLGDLGVLRRVTKKFLNENEVNTTDSADLRTLKPTETALMEKVGMKRKCDGAHALEASDGIMHGRSNSFSKSRVDKLQGNARNLTASATNLAGSKRKAKNGKKPKARSGFRLEVRRPTSIGCEEPVCHSSRTIFAWMLDRGAVLERERIFFMDSGNKQILKEGVVTPEGILCTCCKRIYTAQSFETHAGRHLGNWHQALIFTSGKRLVDCQLKAWDAEIHLRMARNYIGVTEDDPNDDTCVHCGDGGDLICCDGCPSTFHASCLQIDDVPEGNWYCPKCTCGTCGGRQHNEEQDDPSVIFCNQCEHRYHLACLPAGHAVVGKEVLCGPFCGKIFSTLRGLVGVVNPLGRGFSWTLLRSTEEDKGATQLLDSTVAIDYHSKLAVALLVIKECFNPMVDPRTNVDMVTHAIYNRWSNFDRLNYSGFYTAVLEKEGEIISVASIRIHGVRLAEMPLIGTREKFRRQGMCRLLVGVIEKLLCSLEVGFFILPAIPELFETWTHAFGFKPVDEMLKSKLLDISMMVFPGTELLQKPLSQPFTQGLQLLDSNHIQN